MDVIILLIRKYRVLLRCISFDHYCITQNSPPSPSMYFSFNFPIFKKFLMKSNQMTFGVITFNTYNSMGSDFEHNIISIFLKMSILNLEGGCGWMLT